MLRDWTKKNKNTPPTPKIPLPGLQIYPSGKYKSTPPEKLQKYPSGLKSTPPEKLQKHPSEIPKTPFWKVQIYPSETPKIPLRNPNSTPPRINRTPPRIVFYPLRITRGLKKTCFSSSKAKRRKKTNNLARTKN